jgi:hypothetical protein
MGIERTPDSWERQRAFEERQEQYWAKRQLRSGARWRWDRTGSVATARLAGARLTVTREGGCWLPQVAQDGVIRAGPAAPTASAAQQWCMAEASRQ